VSDRFSTGNSPSEGSDGFIAAVLKVVVVLVVFDLEGACEE
jgi:hypothetical protein